MTQKFNSFKIVMVFVIIAFCNFTTLAQRTITGTVTDAENGETLIGANVFVDGTGVGTATDIDGFYSLEVPNSATQLIFSYTGYAEQRITLGASNTVNVVMSSGELLDEVTIIGYGTVKREDATGSIQTVDSKTFNTVSYTHLTLPTNREV